MSFNWHARHGESLGFGDTLADRVASYMGSWRFIILQTVLVAIWMVLNIAAWRYQWDAYPFILLNLVFSTQAAYAAPIIMQSQNRQAERDRHHAEADYQVNVAAKREIENLQLSLARLEMDKLNRIIQILEGRGAKDE